MSGDSTSPVKTPASGTRRQSITLSGTDLSIQLQTQNMVISAKHDTSLSTIGKVVALLGRASSSWSSLDVRTAENLKTIKSFRGVKDGWDGRDAAAPEPSTLNAAEMLAALLGNAPSSGWMKLAIGPDGRPAFATSTSGNYLHLIVEPPANNSNEYLANLSWYSVKDGKEEFVDEVPFDGRDLPNKLRQLIPK